MFVRDGAAQRRRGGAAPRVRCDRVRADARAAIFAFLTRRRARPLPGIAITADNLAFLRAPGPWARGGKCCLYCCGAHTSPVVPFGALVFTGWPLGVSLAQRRAGAPWLKTRHWHQIARALAEALQAARTRAVIISGIEADSGSKGCLRRRSGKGQRESGSKRAALNTI